MKRRIELSIRGYLSSEFPFGSLRDVYISRTNICLRLLRKQGVFKLSNIDGAVKWADSVYMPKTTELSCLKIYRHFFMTHIEQKRLLWMPYTEFGVYCKGRKLHFLHKFFLKLAILGLGRAQVRRSQLVLVFSSKTQNLFVFFETNIIRCELTKMTNHSP